MVTVPSPELPRTALDPADPEPVAGYVLTSDFVDCYRLHYPRLKRALILAGAEPAAAEDVAQEAFARALVHWRRVSRGTNPPGYIYRAAFRLLSRSRRPRPPLPVVSDSPSPEVQATATLSIERALATMPPVRRQCAVLYLILGMPGPEAADAPRMAPGTLRKHVSDARADLRRAWFPAE